MEQVNCWDRDIRERTLKLSAALQRDMGPYCRPGEEPVLTHTEDDSLSYTIPTETVAYWEDRRYGGIVNIVVTKRYRVRGQQHPTVDFRFAYAHEMVAPART